MHKVKKQRVPTRDALLYYLVKIGPVKYGIPLDQFAAQIYFLWQGIGMLNPVDHLVDAAIGDLFTVDFYACQLGI